tara:strand:- start:1626 stop:2486 length:861 start_codon:yes stop_codon:yes gene_type:complete
MTKGILLAGGSGTRLYPITKYLNKHLMPVLDKPMIFYPLSVLMLAGIKDILIIINKNDKKSFEKILGNGAEYGIKIRYEIQVNPNGIAEAIKIGKKFIGKDNFFLILGDNFFYGQFLKKFLLDCQKKNKATIFLYPVNNPKQYGIANLDKKKKILSIEEKPKKPKSNMAITGLYYYPNIATKFVDLIKPSKRGELEISDLNKIFLKKNKLNPQTFGRGFAWLDMGTFQNLLETSSFVNTIEKRQGSKIAILEEIAYYEKLLSKNQILRKIKSIKNIELKKYLLKII